MGSGDHVAIWLDEDPELFEQASQAEDADEFLDDHGWDLPIGVLIDVDDPLRMSAFLGALKALLSSAAPGVMNWQTREVEIDGVLRSYVAIEADDAAGWGDTPSIYYGITPGQLVLSLREKGRDGCDGPAPWLGPLGRTAGRQPRNCQPSERASLRTFAEGFKEVLTLGLIEEKLSKELRRRAWSALPILNEWQRL